MKTSEKKIEIARGKLEEIKKMVEKVDFDNEYFSITLSQLDEIGEQFEKLLNYVHYHNKFFDNLNNKIALEIFEKALNEILKKLSIEQNDSYGKIEDIENVNLYRRISEQLIIGRESGKVILPMDWKEKATVIILDDDELPF